MKIHIRDSCPGKPEPSPGRLSLCFHSVGGLVGRRALPHLEAFKDQMFTSPWISCSRGVDVSMNFLEHSAACYWAAFPIIHQGGRRPRFAMAGLFDRGLAARSARLIECDEFTEKKLPSSGSDTELELAASTTLTTATICTSMSCDILFQRIVERMTKELTTDCMCDDNSSTLRRGGSCSAKKSAKPTADVKKCESSWSGRTRSIARGARDWTREGGFAPRVLPARRHWSMR